MSPLSLMMTILMTMSHGLQLLSTTQMTSEPSCTDAYHGGNTILEGSLMRDLGPFKSDLVTSAMGKIGAASMTSSSVNFGSKSVAPIQGLWEHLSA